MVVFTLRGLHYVLKVVRDISDKSVWSRRGEVLELHRQVHERDRVGRMLDPWNFSNLWFRESNFDSELLQKLVETAPESVRVTDGDVILGHAIIMREVIPLDVFFERTANTRIRRSAILDYGQCIKDLAAAGVWAGQYKIANFGTTRGGRVVLYDYDQMEDLADKNFRIIPKDPKEEEERKGRSWACQLPPRPFRRRSRRSTNTCTARAKSLKDRGLQSMRKGMFSPRNLK